MSTPILEKNKRGCHGNHVFSHGQYQKVFAYNFISHSGVPNEKFGIHEKLSLRVKGNLILISGYMT